MAAGKTKSESTGKRQTVSKSGVLDPERMYTTNALRMVGIGWAVLRDARKSGKVSPRKIGTEHWYLGREIIDWILSQPVVR